MGMFDFIGDAYNSIIRDPWNNLTGATGARQAEAEAEKADKRERDALALKEKIENNLQEARDLSIKELLAAEDEIKAILSDSEIQILRELDDAYGAAGMTVEAATNQMLDELNVSKSDEIDELLSSGVLQEDALREGLTNAKGEMAQTKEEILQNLQDKEIVSREDINAIVGGVSKQFEDQEAKVLEDMVSFGLITQEEFESNTLSGVGSILGFTRKAIDALKPTSEMGRRALALQSINLGIATEDEIRDFRDKYGEPADARKKSPL